MPTKLHTANGLLDQDFVSLGTQTHRPLTVVLLRHRSVEGEIGATAVQTNSQTRHPAGYAPMQPRVAT